MTAFQIVAIILMVVFVVVVYNMAYYKGYHDGIGNHLFMMLNYPDEFTNAVEMCRYLKQEFDETEQPS